MSDQTVSAELRVWDRAPWWLMAAATVYIVGAVLVPSLRVIGLIAGGYLLPFAIVGLTHRHGKFLRRLDEECR